MNIRQEKPDHLGKPVNSDLEIAGKEITKIKRQHKNDAHHDQKQHSSPDWACGNLVHFFRKRIGLFFSEQDFMHDGLDHVIALVDEGMRIIKISNSRKINGIGFNHLRIVFQKGDSHPALTRCIRRKQGFNCGDFFFEIRRIDHDVFLDLLGMDHAWLMVFRFAIFLLVQSGVQQGL